MRRLPRPAEELVASPEYRSTYLKWLQGRDLTDAEQRALTTAGRKRPAVPTQTLNMVIDKMRQTSALFPGSTSPMSRSNLSIVVADAKNAATWKQQEGQDGTPADDTVVGVTLTGYELIKLVEIWPLPRP